MIFIIALGVILVLMVTILMFPENRAIKMLCFYISCVLFGLIGSNIYRNVIELSQIPNDCRSNEVVVIGYCVRQ